eukprot:jgi/Mesen1/2064/ME000150S01156
MLRPKVGWYLAPQKRLLTLLRNVGGPTDETGLLLKKHTVQGHPEDISFNVAASTDKPWLSNYYRCLGYLSDRPFISRGSWASARCFSVGSGPSLDPAVIKKSEEGPLAAYMLLVDSGKLKAGDHRQEEAAKSLQALHIKLEASNNSTSRPSKRTWRSYWPFKWSGPTSSTHGIKGLYMYGGVGTGKTMLMDVFFKHVNVQKKKRVHFHTFMLDMHSRLHHLERQVSLLGGQDPITRVAAELTEECTLLCLDELEVTDVADAMILLRLFSALWPRGVVLVATSNSAPESLYKDGLNRQLFVPFFGLVRKYCEVQSLDEGHDYRRGQSQLPTLFMHPANQAAREGMDEVFRQLAGGQEGRPAKVPVMMGRSLSVPTAAGSVARFDFADLCGSALGAADYTALAQVYHVVMIEGVPWLGDPVRENETRRMVTLIDILYENNTILVCSAETPIEALFMEDEDTVHALEEGKSHLDELGVNPDSDRGDREMKVSGEGGSSGRSTTLIGDMEWSATGRQGVSLAQLAGHTSFTKAASKRTLSRLVEMQTEAYLRKGGELGVKYISWLKGRRQ